MINKYPTIVIGRPDFKRSFVVKAPVPYASIFWGALTGSKKPKQTTNCWINTRPGPLNEVGCMETTKAITIGIKAEAKLVALANPK